MELQKETPKSKKLGLLFNNGRSGSLLVLPPRTPMDEPEFTSLKGKITNPRDRRWAKDMEICLLRNRFWSAVTSPIPPDAEQSVPGNWRMTGQGARYTCAVKPTCKTPYWTPHMYMIHGYCSKQGSVLKGTFEKFRSPKSLWTTSSSYFWRPEWEFKYERRYFKKQVSRNNPPFIEGEGDNIQLHQVLKMMKQQEGRDLLW